MGTLTLVSISLLLSAVAASVALWIRSGETRVGLFGALFFLVAIHQGLSVWSEWDTPLLFNSSALAAVSGLAVGILSVFAIVALWRTLAERDRVERLHWDSMEAVRMMNELAASDRTPFDEKVDQLLAIGAARFGLEVGIVSRVSNDRYEVAAIRAPADFPVRRGAVFSLTETFCQNTLGAERPIGFERISESNLSEPVARTAFGFDSYLGAAIRVGGDACGTLSFGSAEPHRDRFTQTDKDLLRLMAQWLGNEMEKVEGAARAEAGTSATPEPSEAAAPAAREPEPRASSLAPPPRERRAAAPHGPTRDPGREPRRAIDPDQILRRMEQELRSLAGDKVELKLQLDPELGLAAVQRVPLDAIARSLVMNARDAMADGGELVIETANLDFASGEPGVMPAVAPDRYVTISFRDTGSEPDADTLSRLFDPAPEAPEPAAREGRLALSTIYRILQISGGDLSVDVQPGRGSTFTVFLPRADDRAQVPRRPAAVGGTGAGPKLH